MAGSGSLSSPDWSSCAPASFSPRLMSTTPLKHCAQTFQTSNPFLVATSDATLTWSPAVVRSPTYSAIGHAAMSSEYRRSEEHTSELQSLAYLVCRLLLEKKQ